MLFEKIVVLSYMPCKDITDSLKIKLDADDRLVTYALRKKTCQGEVGRKALLRSWLKGQSASEIQKLTLEQLHLAKPTKSDSWEYLYQKHLFAIKAALAVWDGHEGGTVEDYCQLASVEYAEDGTTIDVDISGKGINDEIKACGGCSTCSS